MNYSIIVPIFKEEKNIAKMIRKVQNELSKKKLITSLYLLMMTLKMSQKEFSKKIKIKKLVFL